MDPIRTTKPPLPSSANAEAESQIHVVKAGETLSAIARLYQCDVNEIAAANHLKDPNRIRTGQKLKIPPAKPVQPQSEPGPPSPTSPGRFHLEGKEVYYCSPEGSKCLVGIRRGIGIQRIGSISPASCLETMSNIPASGKRILQLVSRNEGNMDAINTYSDSDVLSVGFLQCSVRWGKLQTLLQRFREDCPQEFDRCFRQQGVDVDPSGNFLLHGVKIGKENWNSVRTDRIAHVFAQAGLTPSFQEAQIAYACFLLDDARKDCPSIRSELGLALYFDSYINGGENGTRANYQDVLATNPSSEAHLLAQFCDRRIGKANEPYKGIVRARIKRILDEGGEQGREIRRLMTSI